MNLDKTIKYVKSVCDCYIESELVIKNINKDYFIVKNPSDFIFINCGLVVPAPLFNEYDIYSLNKEVISVSEKEFIDNNLLKEQYFGVLVKDEKYIIGTIDICDCSVDSRFKPFLKHENELYKKLDEIATLLMR